MNKILKKLRDFYREQYCGLIEAYQKGTLKDEDIEHYLETVPNSFQVLENYKKEQEHKRHVEEYRKAISSKETTSEQLRDEAVNKLQLLTEELDMTSKDYALDPTTARNKHNKINRLQKKIDETLETIRALDQIIEVVAPKRKPGRPKKEKGTSGDSLVED